MGVWQIYTKNGTERKDRDGRNVEIHSLSWNGKLMGESAITATIKSPVVIDFAIGDYIDYRGQRYVLSVTPSVQKQARVRTVGNSIIYDSVKFTSLAGDEMTRCEFRDEVLGNEQHYNFASRQFVFYCASLIDFSDRVKANMNRLDKARSASQADSWRVFTLCTKSDGTQYYYESGAGAGVKENDLAPDQNGTRRISLISNHDEAVGKKNVTININEQMVWDALQNVKDVFDVNFVVIGRCIFIGANGNVLGQHFTYGMSDDDRSIDTGHGLFKFERTTNESQAVVTRLRAYGSDKNMPTRYYRNVGIRCYVPVVSENVSRFDSHLVVVRIDESVAIKLKFKNPIETSNPSVHQYNLSATVGSTTLSGWYTYNDYGGDYTIDLVTADEAENTAVRSALSSSGKIIINTNADKDKWPTEYKTAASNSIMPNNMNVKNLMLPGFGFEGNSLYKEASKVYTRKNEADLNLIRRIGHSTFASLCSAYNFSDDPTDPYIEAIPQIREYGVREHSVTFSGSGDEEEIFPSIEHVLGTDASGKTLAVVKSCENPQDNGIVDDNDTDKEDIMMFEIVIPDVGFAVEDQLSTSSPVISMLDGKCGGREFEIFKSTRNNDGTCTLRCKRTPDSSLDLYFPYSSFGIKPGDRFSLLNLELPDKYVDGTALYALLPASLEFLDKNRDVRSSYSLTVDNIHLARQHDSAVQKNDLRQSVYWNMKAGDLVMFGDEDLGVNVDPAHPDSITGSIIIDSLEIKEGEGRVPHVTIQLVDEVSVGTLQSMQKQIDGIVKGTITVGSAANSAGYNAGDIQRMIRTFGSQWFLSKQYDDSTSGSIGIAKDLVVGNDAWVRGTLHVTKLQADNVEVMEAKSVGGKLIDTAANAIIDEIVDGDEYWECRFKAKDENGKIVNNMFVPSDFIFCEQFEVDAASDYVQSKCYWRALTGVGSGESEDGEPYNYVRISKTESHESWKDVPEVGDNILQWGNSAIEDRRGAIVFSPVGAIAYMDTKTGTSRIVKAPYFAQYTGIKELVTPNPTQVISKSLTMINADRITFKTSDQGTKDIEDVIGDSFRIYSLDIEAEVDDTKQIGEPGYFVDPELGSLGWPETEENWPLSEYNKHVNDIAICTNSAYYRWSFDGGYGWHNITDQVLIESIRTAKEAQDLANSALGTLSNMANDNIIDGAEKVRLADMLIQIEKEHSGIIVEAGNANANYRSYDDAYKLLRAFITYFIADPYDTYLFKDGKQLLAEAVMNLDGEKSYVVGYYTKDPLKRQTGYKDALSLYYASMADLRKAITFGVYDYIDEMAIEGGYDEETTKNVRRLWNVFSDYCENQSGPTEERALGLLEIEDRVSSMSNWLRDPLHGSADYGSGIVTTANYASMFSTAIDPETGQTLAQALAMTYVQQTADGWISGYKIIADEIIIDTDNFKIDKNGDVTVYGILDVKSMQQHFLDIRNIEDSDGFSPYGVDDLQTNYYHNAINGQPVVTKGFFNLLCTGMTVVLPTDAKYIGQRVVLYDNNTKTSGGTSNVTRCYINGQEGGSISSIPFRGVGIRQSTTSQALWDYKEVYAIDFVNGAIEFLGVPSEDGTKTDWLVVGISTKSAMAEDLQGGMSFI